MYSMYRNIYVYEFHHSSMLFNYVVVLLIMTIPIMSITSIAIDVSLYRFLQHAFRLELT